MEYPLEIVNTGDSVQSSGTSLIGYVNATITEIEILFGENLGPSGDDKVFNEFRGEVQSSDGDVETVTVYDWKEKSPFTAQSGEYRWHVGGFNHEAVYLVNDLLEELRVKHEKLS